MNAESKSSVSFDERAITFVCANEHLVGVIAIPGAAATRGVLIVVGGPQYRVGSHRQFLLLSRQLAAAGFAVMRFDYRGMGDSSGEPRTFEAIADDVRIATDVFFREVPALSEVVIWGLCDAASAALLHVVADPRVRGLALANPWVRTPEGQARALVKHYYGAQVLRRDFWQRLLRGDVQVFASLRGLLGNVRLSRQSDNSLSACLSFPERMASGLDQFRGQVLIFLSGQDLTAQEFEVLIAASPPWRDALARPTIEWRRLAEATHTFSSQAWRDQVGAWTIDWLKSW